jgi:hypothetical protein
MQRRKIDMTDQKIIRKRKTGNSDIRQENHLRRLGTREPRCANCGENDPATLTGRTPDIICYECQAKASERSPIEWHHPAGRNNDPLTFPVPGNDHRILSDLQKDWPQETLRNPTGSPLRKAAATIRGFLDMLRLFIERLFGWIPDFLETLDGKLIELFGAIWWETLGLSGGIAE